MRLDLYLGETPRFLYFDLCACFEVTNNNNTAYLLEYTNCCPQEPEATLTVPSNSSIRLHGAIPGFETPAPGIVYEQINLPYEPNETLACNECFQYKYKLYNCINDTVIYTDYLECPDCIYYINQFVRTYLEPNPCWFITVTEEPVGTITPVEINGEGYCDFCEGKCYTVTGTGVITYFNGYGEYSTADAPAIICSSSYPSVTGTNNEIVTNNLFCDNRNPCSYYYRLTNCVTQVTILSNEPDLAFPYALDETVKLAEYPGACWTIEQFPLVY